MARVTAGPPAACKRTLNPAACRLRFRDAYLGSVRGGSDEVDVLRRRGAWLAQLDVVLHVGIQRLVHLVLEA